MDGGRQKGGRALCIWVWGCWAVKAAGLCAWVTCLVAGLCVWGGISSCWGACFGWQVQLLDEYGSKVIA